MCDTYWWSKYGSFKPWKQCPTRPDPGEVLSFYLGKNGIGRTEQVDYLSEILDLQKSMVYNVLKGEGFDLITRCRQLVQALKIHPPLLGIDAKYYSIERHPCWWRAYGFPFHADAQGYPLMSEVVVYLRLQRTQVVEEGLVKVWSQEDLGKAIGLRKEIIYRMEHDRNPLVLEHMSRRALMAFVFGIHVRDQEPIIFRLFGLDPQAYGVQVSSEDVVLEVHDLPKCLTDEALHGYYQTLTAFFNTYYTSHSYDIMDKALEWIRRLTVLQSLAHTTSQRVDLLVLQCRYHLLLVGVACEQQDRDSILLHADRAVELAEQSVTLPNSKLGNDHVLLAITNELWATSLLWRSDAYYILGDYMLAKTAIDQALNLLPTLQSMQLKLHIVAYAGMIHSYTANSDMDRALALSYFNLAGQLNASVGFLSTSDESYMFSCAGIFYLCKAIALSVSNIKGLIDDSVLDLLEKSRKFTDPIMIRRHITIEVFQAQAYFDEGNYIQATKVAIAALEESRLMCSRLNRDRINKLYHRLLETDFRCNPLLSRLGVNLRMWDWMLDSKI